MQWHANRGSYAVIAGMGTTEASEGFGKRGKNAVARVGKRSVEVEDDANGFTVL
jgi:hypothetical protein